MLSLRASAVGACVVAALLHSVLALAVTNTGQWSGLWYACGLLAAALALLPSSCC